MIGAALAGMLGDRLGRKKVLVLSAILFTVSALGAALPNNLAQFVLARMLGGLGVGMASMLSPLYIAEVAPARIRGRLVSLNQVTIILGMLIISIVNWLIASPDNESWNVATGWRWMFASGAVPAVLFLVCLFLVPESPRWLVKQEREDEALVVLTRVGGRQLAQVEMAGIKDAIAHEGGDFGDLFRPGVRVALVIALVLAVLQQVTGINAVLYYAPKIFASAGVSDTQALLQTAALSLVNVLFTLVAIWLVDRAGRKPLLLATSAAMGISLLLLGAAFQLGLAAAWIFAFTLAYVASFAIAIGTRGLGGAGRNLSHANPRPRHVGRHGLPVDRVLRGVADGSVDVPENGASGDLLDLRRHVPRGDWVRCRLGPRNQGQNARTNRAKLAQRRAMNHGFHGTVTPNMAHSAKTRIQL